MKRKEQKRKENFSTICIRSRQRCYERSLFYLNSNRSMVVRTLAKKNVTSSSTKRKKKNNRNACEFGKGKREIKKLVVKLNGKFCSYIWKDACPLYSFSLFFFFLLPLLPETARSRTVWVASPEELS